MKRLFLFTFLLLFAFPCHAQEMQLARMGTAVAGSGGGAAALSCSASAYWADLTQASGEGITTTDDAANGYPGNTDSIQICKARMFLTTGAAYHLEVWTDNAMAGSQLGGDSDSVTPGSSGLQTFTWASNYPNPTGAYYVHIIVESGTGAVGVNDSVSPNGILWINGSQKTWENGTGDLYKLQ